MLYNQNEYIQLSSSIKNEIKTAQYKAVASANIIEVYKW